MNLKQLRLSKGISPSFVASKIGVTYRHFNRIESEGTCLTEDREEILAVIYDTTIEDIKKCAKESER